MTQSTESHRTQSALEQALEGVQRNALIVGGAGAVLCIIGAIVSRAEFFQSYLFAYMFWLGISVGMVAIILVYRLAGGGWGFGVQRIAETGGMTLPLMAVLFLPILLGLPYLYPWTRPDVVAANPLLQHRAVYFNVPFFILRAILYLGIWVMVAYLLSRWSLQHDRTGDPYLLYRLRVVARVGIVLFVLSISFASFDWLMSLEPDFFSAVFGFLLMTSMALAGMAFATIVARRLMDYDPLDEVITRNNLNDYGNLLLTSVMLWGYMTLSQFLIIWMGNLPDEVPWYVRRSADGWAWITALLVAFQFALPFVVLLARPVKRSRRLLPLVALLILAINLIYQYWIVMPAFYPTGIHLHWLNIVTPIAIGGLWIALFARQLRGKSLVPLNEPKHLEEALELKHG